MQTLPETPQQDDAAAVPDLQDFTETTTQTVQQTTVRVLTERVRLLGVDRSGAYDHYHYKLQHGFPIPSYEVAIVKLVREKFPDLVSYHEIGSGLGTLPFMLALEGFAAVGVERDERRHLTATAILAELQAQAPSIETNCRLIWAPFPEAIADMDVSGSMAILTDFVATHSPAEFARICRELGRYRYVLLDLQRFVDKRDAGPDQQEVTDILVQYGFTPCDEVIDLGYEGYYRLFAGNTAAGERRGAIVAKAGEEAGGRQFSAPQTAETVPTEVLGASSVVAATAQPPVPFTLPPMPQRRQHKRFGVVGLSALLMIGIPTLLAVAYYFFIAADQYVTTFQFAVRGASMEGAAHKSGRVSGITGMGSMSPDAFVVTDFINSHQSLEDVEKETDVRALFGTPIADFFARLPPDATREELDTYWRKMVSAQFDVITGNVSASVRAFTAADSLRLAKLLIAASDSMFKEINSEAERNMVKLADENLKRAEDRLTQARQALLEFRDASGIIDPGKVALSNSVIVDDLRKQLSGLVASYSATHAAFPQSPALPPLKSRIVALERQIKAVSKAKPNQEVTEPVTPAALGKYEKLDLERQFAEKQYTEALELREQAYLGAQQQQSYLALFVSPTLPQQPLYPDRTKSVAIVFLAAAAAWFFSVLITYAIRDHLM
ncbi:MAG: hypothetical protein ACM3JG_02805 [Thiohalocapsa sp.]